MSQMPFPIIAHQESLLQKQQREFDSQIAQLLMKEKPNLALDPIFRDLACHELAPARALHVDDLSEIAYVSSSPKLFLQERARLRACDGDLLATSLPAVPGYEAYCRDQLGLGDVTWLRPEVESDSDSRSLRLAEFCWEDRETRRDIVHAIRSDDLRYLHPHMGSKPVWELALLLSQTSHRDVKVIGAPPEVSKFVNDKGEFAKLIKRMFGKGATPESGVAWNFAVASERLRDLNATTKHVAVKLPDAAGGSGNVLIPMSDVQGRTLHEIDELLHERLERIHYESGDELLVTTWADDVIAAPSAQLWIPPRAQGLPILEGLFMQTIEGDRGIFTGFGPADLPPSIREQMTRQCLQVAHVFQLLGYVGRCSLDTILVGPSIEQAALQFIECNGRWGGTSLPMTMMNRIFGDWKTQPFQSQQVKLDSLGSTFADVSEVLQDRLYKAGEDAANKIVLLNPQAIQAAKRVSFVALKESWSDVSDARGWVRESLHKQMQHKPG